MEYKKYTNIYIYNDISLHAVLYIINYVFNLVIFYYMSGLANAYTPGRCVFIILIYNILMNKNVITFQGIKARDILLCKFFLTVTCNDIF